MSVFESVPRWQSRQTLVWRVPRCVMSRKHPKHQPKGLAATFFLCLCKIPIVCSLDGLWPLLFVWLLGESATAALPPPLTPCLEEMQNLNERVPIITCLALPAFAGICRSQRTGSWMVSPHRELTRAMSGSGVASTRSLTPRPEPGDEAAGFHVATSTVGGPAMRVCCINIYRKYCHRQHIHTYTIH